MSPRRAWSWALVAALPIALGCAPSTRSTDGSAMVSRPYVVLVSFDAFRHDYVERYRPAAFTEIATRGVHASALIPSFPSKTFPNHYTIVTGLYPGHHGIVGNAFYDPGRSAWYRMNDLAAVHDSSWYGGEPIWATAERRGVKSGVYFWPGSEAAIGGVRPSYFAKYDGKVPSASRVNGAISWLRKPASARPHLVLLYFSEVDGTTHRYGPDAPETATVVASVDRTLRQLLDSISKLPFADSVNVVVVSDHGMAQIPPKQVVPVDEIVLRAALDTAGIRMSDDGPTMSLWFGDDSARMRRAHAALQAQLRHARAYYRWETPSAWHVHDNPRAGDVLLVADEGFFLVRHRSKRDPPRGSHGYDPALANMQGIFMAAGPNVRQLGLIPDFENVQVYPFLAALLRLDGVPVVDGDTGALTFILR